MLTQFKAWQGVVLYSLFATANLASAQNGVPCDGTPIPYPYGPPPGVPCDAMPGGPAPAPHAAPACRSPQHVYVCPCPTCQTRGAPENAPIPENSPFGNPESGAYVAPPQTGTQVASSQQMGISGLSIRFPELKIGLPSIELPHLTRRARGAHMELDSAIADFRAMPQSTSNFPMAATTAFTAAASGRRESAPAPESAKAPPTKPTTPENARLDEMQQRCLEMAERLKQKEALLNAKMMELDHQLQMLRCQPAPVPCPQPQPPQCPQPPPLAPPTNPGCAPELLPHPYAAPLPPSSSGMIGEAIPYNLSAAPYGGYPMHVQPAAFAAPVPLPRTAR